MPNSINLNFAVPGMFLCSNTITIHKVESVIGIQFKVLSLHISISVDQMGLFFHERYLMIILLILQKLLMETIILLCE